MTLNVTVTSTDSPHLQFLRLRPALTPPTASVSALLESPGLVVIALLVPMPQVPAYSAVPPVPMPSVPVFSIPEPLAVTECSMPEVPVFHFPELYVIPAVLVFPAILMLLMLLRLLHRFQNLQRLLWCLQFQQSQCLLWHL